MSRTTISTLEELAAFDSSPSVRLLLDESLYSAARVREVAEGLAGACSVSLEQDGTDLYWIRLRLEADQQGEAVTLLGELLNRVLTASLRSCTENERGR